MSKFIILLVLLLTVIQFEVAAQRQYLVEYDKLSDTFSFFEEIRRNDEVERKSIRRIEPELGDEVKVIVKNVNEFIYKTSVEFRAGKVVSEGDASSNDLLGVIAEFAAPGIGNIAQVASVISRSAGTRSDITSNKSITDAIQILENEIIFQNSRNADYLNLLDLMSNETITLDKLKNSADSIVSAFREKSVDHEFDFLRIDTLNSVLSSPVVNKAQKEYIAQLLSLMNISKVSSGNQLSIFDDAQVVKIKKLIDESDFQYSATNIIGFSAMIAPGSSESMIDVDDEVKSFDIVIKFEKIDPLATVIQDAEKPVLEVEKPEQLRFYSTYKWRNSNGNVVDEGCPTCTPLVLAEGFYTPKNGKIPLELEDLYLSSFTGHFGTWKFYDEETGNLKTYYTYPKKTASYYGGSYYDDEDFEEDEDNEDNEDEEEDNSAGKSKVLETHYRLAHLNLKRYKGPRFSTCLLLNRTFDARNQYDLIWSPSDSVMIKSYEVNEYTPSIGVTAGFDLIRHRAFIPSLNVGASLNVLSDADNQKLNFHLGGGLHFGKSANFAISGGLSLCRSQVLRNRYQSDVWYDDEDSEYNSIVDFYSEEGLFRDVFKTGYYFGFGISF